MNFLLMMAAASSFTPADKVLLDKLSSLQAEEKILKKQLKSRNIVIKGKQVFILQPVK